MTKYRAYGSFGVYTGTRDPLTGEICNGQLPRVWVAEGPDELTPETIITLKDAHGTEIQCFAGEPGLVLEKVKRKS